MSEARSRQAAGLQWKRLDRRRFGDVEDLLYRRELFCVSACSRFLYRERFSSQLWGFSNPGDSLTALLLHSKGTLFPVSNSRDTAAFGPSLLYFLKKNYIHAVQGLREDVLALEKVMEDTGRQSIDEIDYDLMILDNGPSPETLRAGPPGLSIRKPELWELDDIFPLQSAYETEEVLPRGAVFNAAACRVNLKHILKEETALVAELKGQIIAKANTSAVSFTRAQIGGVFVHPGCRGQGIARRVCAELAGILINAGWGVSLFVKKRNRSAQIVYRSIGFKPIADYRITYY
ncbi:MAG: GNAT family N-acetyltransferase [Treponema sp.]|nr:GNAT family N-acetyltransferase [Treponema sp.]